MIVELYGLPGSGKTTFVRKVSASPDWIRVIVSGKKEILRYYILGCLFHPVVYIKGFAHCIVRNRSLFYLWNFYIVRYAKYQKARHLSSRNVFAVLDEGPLQTIISYPEKVLEKKELMSYLQLLPKVDKVIVFDIDANRRKTQLRERVHNQSWRKTHEKDEDWDSIMVKNDALFKKYASEKPLYYFFDGVMDWGDLRNCIQESLCK